MTAWSSFDKVNDFNIHIMDHGHQLFVIHVSHFRNCSCLACGSPASLSHTLRSLHATGLSSDFVEGFGWLLASPGKYKNINLLAYLHKSAPSILQFQTKRYCSFINYFLKYYLWQPSVFVIVVLFFILCLYVVHIGAFAVMYSSLVLCNCICVYCVLVLVGPSIAILYLIGYNTSVNLVTYLTTYLRKSVNGHWNRWRWIRDCFHGECKHWLMDGLFLQWQKTDPAFNALSVLCQLWFCCCVNDAFMLVLVQMCSVHG